MASTQEAEIQFAQRLASNEKPVRSKALLKLRRYMSARSGRDTGGFAEDDLLKIWKGLFYCMWMQDMPLLQEELACKISGLVHSFQTADSQLLFFSTFLQTMKREWNGIDRLRMDKFYQLVRFVLREVFEALRRRLWDSSVVRSFLQQFSAQLLLSSSSAPAGLVLHVLEIYTTELARVGSAELTAEQNLTFIEPFCRTMAKTKDRVLLKAISSNIFDPIVDQVPFAVDDLLRELHQAGGEEPEGSEGSEGEQKRNAQENDSEEDGDDEDACALPDGMDRKNEYACGPVLQFDYGAIADRLFEVASHSNIPSFNRAKIYKLVKIFRDLCEGLFPQNEVQDVSTDEDEFDDGTRRRKTKKQIKKQEARKKAKGQSGTSADPDASQDTKQKNKKGKKRKRKNGSLKTVEGEADQQSEAQTPTGPSDPSEEQEPNADRDGENKSDREERDGEEQPSGVRPLKKRRKRKTAVRKTNEDPTEEKTAEEKTAEEKTAEEIKLKDTGEMRLTCSGSAGVDEQSEEQQDSQETNGSKAQVKKKQKKQKDAGEMEVTCPGSAGVDEQPEEQQDSQETDGSKAQVKKKQKKQKDVAVPKPSTNGDAHQTGTLMGAKKRRKQKPGPAEQIKPERKRTAKEEDVKLNGHAGETSGKRPKIMGEAAALPVSKQKQFVLRQKKAPAPLFCRAAGYMLSRKVLQKKVRFGLKNNKTMEFRKMDRSSQVSPASQSRVPFDPNRTPKSGVLKSPSSSPAVTRRAMAADFF